MGNCLVRLQAEMVSPPPNSGNWEVLGPRKVVLNRSSLQQAQMRRRSGGGESGDGKGNGVPLRRRETPSGIEGLTFDYAGRPVWRDPKLKTHNSHNSDDSDVSKVEYIKEKL